MLLLRLEYDRMNNYYTSIELGSDTIKIERGMFIWKTIMKQ